MIKFITNPETIVMFLAFAGAFVTILALGLQFTQTDRLSARLKAVSQRREELSRRQKEELAGKRKHVPQKHVDFMKLVMSKLKLDNLIASKEMRTKLSQGGYRSQNAAIVFGFTRLVVPLALVAGSLVFFATAKDAEFDFVAKAMVLGGAALLGFYLPNVVLSNIVQKRQQAVERSFPDALDLLTICVEAGLSVEAAFNRVALEMGESSPELAEEFGLTTAELAFLGDRRLAFDNLSNRTGIAPTKSLSTSLMQSEKYGTPVSTSLKVLSKDNRDHRMSLAEKKAGALPAQLTVPMIVFFLPVLFVVILGPAVIQIIRM